MCILATAHDVESSTVLEEEDVPDGDSDGQVGSEDEHRMTCLDSNDCLGCR